jgi:NADPH2:quinone reductase
MKYIEHGKGGGPECMVLIDGPVPQPAPGQILIEVVCAGVNRPDVCSARASTRPRPTPRPSSASKSPVASRQSAKA